jgi:uncharacterized membrane protein YbhN (UPF0104 family)
MSSGVFVLLTVFGALLMTNDGVLERTGRLVQSVRNKLRRHSPPLTTLPDRLRRERDRLQTTLGTRWKGALVATVGRWAFDYGVLLAALAALGAHPVPSLVLLAFCAAQVLAQIPITPGGLGFVEAGLTATFVYRLFTYWIPLPVGLVAFGLHKRHAARAAARAAG